MHTRTAIGFALVILLAVSPMVSAQVPSFTPSPYIYKITAGECQPNPTSDESRLSTGFRVKGQLGIVTALHAVVGCQAISAILPSFNQVLGLKIIKVDIARDVAILWSESFNADITNGLEGINNPETSDYQVIKVIGYPYGLAQRKLDVKVIELIELRKRLTDSQNLEFNKQQSPSTAIKVLDVQGDILPGHSGAPLLNVDGKIIGIADGGQQSGSVGIAWAIPWEQIQWKVVPTELSSEEKARLRNLVISAQQFATPGNIDDYKKLAPEFVPDEVKRSDLEADAINTVEKFQKARSVAYNTWKVSGYYGVLKGDALQASLSLAKQIQAAQCRYYIGSPEVKYAVFVSSPSEVQVYAVRYEEQRRVCKGIEKRVCLGYQIRYTLEQQNNKWFITHRSSEIRPIVQCKQKQT